MLMAGFHFLLSLNFLRGGRLTPLRYSPRLLHCSRWSTLQATTPTSSTPGDSVADLAGEQDMATTALPVAAPAAVAPAPPASPAPAAAPGATVAVSTTIAGEKRPTTFYRRQLKPPCIAFSSAQGRQLFQEALVEGNMESYFRLAEQFRTQDDPAFCGLTTLTMVLNALAVDPGRVWKGPWRWYHESMLDCCAPLDAVRENGITLNTLACLARCNGLAVDMRGPATHSIESLRAAIEECSAQDSGKVVVVSYDRRGLKQTGSGHFSPIGGFHKEKDLVLILDTARFKLPPHWAPLDALWEAMKKIDPETNKPRGFMVLERAHSLSHRVFTANTVNYKQWPKVASWVKAMVELASVSGGSGTADSREFQEATTVAEFVPLLLARLPPMVRGLLTTFPTTCPTCSGQMQDGIVLQAIQGTEAYKEVHRVELESSCANGSATNNRSSSCGESSNGNGNGNSNSTSNNVSRDHGAAGRPNGSVSTTNQVSSMEHSSGCGCSSRHILSIMTYALLSMLHDRDLEVDGLGQGTHVWCKDPLRLLPPTVAEEAIHVAAMLGGLVVMKCEENEP